MLGHEIILLEAPVGGLRRDAGYQQKPPYYSEDLLNVRAFDVIEGRGRIGSRPGLTKAFLQRIGVAGQSYSQEFSASKDTWLASNAPGIPGDSGSTNPDGNLFVGVGLATTEVARSIFHFDLTTLSVDRIVNGSFSADSNWTKGVGWNISGSNANTTGAISTELSQTVAPLVVGITYRVRFTVTRTGGSITPVCGTTNGTPRSSTGTFTENIVCAGTGDFKFTTVAFNGNIDNVSARQIPTAITDANLMFSAASTGVAATGLVRRLTQTGWVESQATWNSYATSTAWMTAGGDYTATDEVQFMMPVSTGGFLIGGLATLVLDAITSRADQLHVLMMVGSETVISTKCRFWQSESLDPALAPKLTVTYELPI